MHSIPTLTLCVLLAAPCLAGEVVIAVGGDKSAGQAAGTWAKSLTKGFKLAGEALAQGGETTVIVKVATGDYDGDLGSGSFLLPELHNPQGTLRLEGGYSADFARRDPLRTPSRIVTVRERSAPLIQLHPSRPEPESAQMELKALHMDGFVCDVADSNNYDPQTRALLRGRGTSAQPVIRWGDTKVGYFELANCVFLNSPQRAFETLLRPAHEQVKFRLYNCVFLNCVSPVRLGSIPTPGGKVVEVEVDRCSFLLNWAPELESASEGCCALELAGKDQLERVRVTNSLFYANFGGGILVPKQDAPALVLMDNDFVGNGLLHGQRDPGAAAVVVEASGKREPCAVDGLEDLDVVSEAKGNLSLLPELALSPGGQLAGEPAQDPWERRLELLLGRRPAGEALAPGCFAPRQAYDPARPPFPSDAAGAKFGATFQSN